MNEQNLPFFLNDVIDKKGLKKVISVAFSKYGTKRASSLVDGLKYLGFSYATKAAFSLSLEDLRVPKTKRSLVSSARETLANSDRRLYRANINGVERLQKAIDTWNYTNELVKEDALKYFRETDPFNSVYMMALSGARGNISQVRQLVGMRGLMSDSNGQIIDLPIVHNFREGLTVTEYLISSYGARKGLVDTALRTADSGYLTRRLVDVAQSIIIRSRDCQTNSGLRLSDIVDQNETVLDLSTRLLGRVSLLSVYSSSGELVIEPNTLITPNVVSKLKKSGIKSLVVRSPLTCKSRRSICQLCYGWSLATNTLIDLGEAVGILAAQSIGEPGTQLTMRTFHTGGVFTASISNQITSVNEGSVIYDEPLNAVETRTRHGDVVKKLESSFSFSIQPNNQKVFLVPGSLLYVSHDQRVEKSQLLAELPTSSSALTTQATKELLTNVSGEVYFDNVTLEEKQDRQGNLTRISQYDDLMWVLRGDVLDFPAFLSSSIYNGQAVTPRTPLMFFNYYSERGGKVTFSPSGDSVDIATASLFVDDLRVKLVKWKLKKYFFTEFFSNDIFSITLGREDVFTGPQRFARWAGKTFCPPVPGIVSFVNDSLLNLEKLNFIPQEIYPINRASSPLLVQNSQVIELGQELIKNVVSTVAGMVEISEQNGVVREVRVKPCEAYCACDLNEFNLSSPKFINEGDSLGNGINCLRHARIEIISSPIHNVNVIVRPIVEYWLPNNSTFRSHLLSSKSNLSSDFNFGLHVLTAGNFKIDKFVSVSAFNSLINIYMECIPKQSLLNSPISFSVLPDLRGADFSLSFKSLEKIVFDKSIFGPIPASKVKLKKLVENNEHVSPLTVIGQLVVFAPTFGFIKRIEKTSNLLRVLFIGDDSIHEIEKTPDNQALQVNDFLLPQSKPELGEENTLAGQIISVADNSLQVREGKPYLILKGSLVHAVHNSLVQRGDRLGTLIYESVKTEDIVQGLPRVEEILEARVPKNSCLLSPFTGIASYEKENSQIVITDSRTNEESSVSLLLKDRPIFSTVTKVSLCQPLTEGPVNPHELLEFRFLAYSQRFSAPLAARLSLRKTQKFLVEEVQRVYLSQGVQISDKHIEIIVKQMTSKVKVENGGGTTFLPGEILDLQKAQEINENLMANGSEILIYKPILLGITKASLNTESFISAASFQETTRVLTEAAIEGKIDWLKGLKENVILGRLIPAGTGFTEQNEPAMISVPTAKNFHQHVLNLRINNSTALSFLS